MSALFPVSSARQSLAARFELFHDDGMQDWEYQVADASRFQEFVEAYRHARLSDAERVSLMEMLVQCVEDLLCVDTVQPPESLSEWQAIAALLRRDVSLHLPTIDYWSCLDEPDLTLCFTVSGPMRALRAGLQPHAP